MKKIIVFILLLLSLNIHSRPVTIMGIGDSITEGGETFCSYMGPLSRLLEAVRLNCLLIGVKNGRSDGVTYRHSGYGGKNTEFIESMIDSIYTACPADIVLLHSGHNHFVEEKPVAGIVNSQLSIIERIHRINPDAVIIVAGVIHSGKLPKYSYIPQLNKKLAEVIHRLNDSRIVFADINDGFDWREHTIQDKVHPNRTGAYIMACNWLKAIEKCLRWVEHDGFCYGKDNLSTIVGPISTENVTIDPFWNIWCGSVVKGYDNRYHMYYSRWPRGTHHEGWISHSEIAHAVAEKPGGPYRHSDVSLPAYSDTAWDGAMTHNPYIICHNGKYYLYFIATQGKRLKADQTISAYGEEWWRRRNTQRIGLAVADNPFGPWERLETPVLSVSEDSTAFDAMCVTNPAVCVGRNGKVVMLYKAVCKNGTMRGGNVRFSVAFADKMEGPFTKTRQLIFQSSDSSARMVAEDPYIWYDQKVDMYYAIVRDVIHIFTGKSSGGLVLMESKDAIHWDLCQNARVLPPSLPFTNGSVYLASENNVERPYLLRDQEGYPLYLFGAFGVNSDERKREHSFNAAIPFIK